MTPKHNPMLESAVLYMVIRRLGLLLSLALGQSASAQIPITSAWEDWSEWRSPAQITGMGPQDSILWMSTRDGLARIPIQGGPITVQTTRNTHIPFDNLTSVDVAQEGEVLLGSPHGAVVKGENGSWTAYTAANAPLMVGVDTFLNQQAVSGFTRTPDGKLWLATQAYALNGLTGKVTDFNQYSPEVENRSLHEYNAGRVLRFDGTDWQTIYEGRGSEDSELESMLGMINDGAGGVWTISRDWRIESSSIHIILYGTMSQRPNGSLGFLDINSGGIRRPWVSGFQATPKGMWASFYGDLVTSPSYRRSLFFCPADTTVRIGVTISLDSLQGSGVDDSHPAHVFALDTNGNPWVLTRNALYGFDETGKPSGTELLPDELSARGPFREMRFDRQGILFLRTDSAVYWKVKPNPITVGVLRADPGPKSLVRRRPGMGMTYPWSGRIPGEYFHLNGRRLRITEIEKPPVVPSRSKPACALWENGEKGGLECR